MVTTSFVSSTDAGTQIRVSDFIKQPSLVQSVVAKMLDKQFIADALLRQVPGAPGGVVKFQESEPLFADGIEVIAEYGEIPVAKGADGVPQAVFSVKGGGALVISREMIRRNDIDAVNRRLKQIKNGMTKFWDDRFMSAIWAAAIPTYAVPLAWTDTTSNIPFDLAKSNEVAIGQVDGNGNEFNFAPDTLVVHPLRASAMTYNNAIQKFFQGNAANDNPLYTGDTGREVQGFKLLRSYRMPLTKALLCERKTLGFISDEVATETTPMYEQRERQSHRSDTTRTSAVGIDAPKSAVILNGI